MDATPEVWRYRRWVVVVIAAVVILVGVAVLLLMPSDPASAVDWENYDPGLQTQIEQLAAAGDCAALDEMRAEAQASESDQIEQTGNGNEDLIRFIDSELESTECAVVGEPAVSG